jgi:hypothetical protein
MRVKTSQKEGIFATVAALLVLFSAMVDPKASAALAVLALLAFSFYKFRKG